MTFICENKKPSFEIHVINQLVLWEPGRMSWSTIIIVIVINCMVFVVVSND